MSDDPTQVVLDRLAERGFTVEPKRGYWMAQCAGHPHDHEPSLSIRRGEDGKCLLHCFVCEVETAANVTAALGLKLGDLFSPSLHAHELNGQVNGTVEPITLARLAKAKGFSVAELQAFGLHEGELYGDPAVLIPYWLPDGTLAPVTRARVGVSAKRSKWRKGDALLPYGLERLASWRAKGALVCVEGESDCWALWSAGFPAIGIPGASSWKCLEAEHVEGFRRLYLVREPDEGGKKFVAGLHAHLHAIGWQGQIKVVAMPPGIKDPCELRQAHPDGFKERMVQLLQAAEPFAPGISAFVPYVPFVPGYDFGPTIPEFPVDLVPEPIGSLIREAAAALPVPKGFVGLPALIVVGAAVGNRVRLVMKEGYEVMAVFWGAIVGRPGAKKTAAIRSATRALSQLQHEASEQFKVEHATWESAHEEWLHEKGADRGQAPVRPRLQHFLTTDATIEALAQILEYCSAVMIRDELVGWVSSFDMYRSGSQGADRARMLELWSSVSQKIDRASKDKPPIYLVDPHLCVVGGIQPDMLSKLADEAGRQDGFLDRFLWCWPNPVPNRWNLDVLRNATVQGFRELLNDLRRDSVPETIFLSPDANTLFGLWYEANDALGARSAGLRAGMYAKFDSHVTRLALVLHLIEYRGAAEARFVSFDTLLRAMHLTEYFRAHACRVADRFLALGPAPKSLPGRALKALGEQDDWMNKRSIRDVLGHGTGAQVLDDALDELCQLGLVEARRPEREGPGRRGLQWRIKPQGDEADTESSEGGPDSTKAQTAQMAQMADFTADCLDVDGLAQQARQIIESERSRVETKEDW